MVEEEDVALELLLSQPEIIAWLELSRPEVVSWLGQQQQRSQDDEAPRAA